MGDWFESQAAAGSLALAIPVAVIAGLVAFFSPCTLPLLPGYLSYATGLSGAEVAGVAAGEQPPRRGRMLLGSTLFVVGFAAVFVLYAAVAGGASVFLRSYQQPISIVMGVVLILLGLVFAGFVPWAQREWRIRTMPSVGLGAAPLVGAIFALGWTPCIGPTFSVILTLTYLDGGTAARGAVLALFYALGIGVPFILVAIFYSRSQRALRWVRRHQRAVMRAGGLMLVLVGVLLVTGWWDYVIQWAQGLMPTYVAPV